MIDAAVEGRGGGHIALAVQVRGRRFVPTEKVWRASGGMGIAIEPVDGKGFGVIAIAAVRSMTYDSLTTDCGLLAGSSAAPRRRTVQLRLRAATRKCRAQRPHCIGGVLWSCNTHGGLGTAQDKDAGCTSRTRRCFHSGGCKTGQPCSFGNPQSRPRPPAQCEQAR